MNKRAAKKATDEFEGTIGDLRALIGGARDRKGASCVNPAFQVSETLDIYTAAIDGRSDDEAITIWRPDRCGTKGYMKRTRDAMLVQNILRECA